MKQSEQFYCRAINNYHQWNKHFLFLIRAADFGNEEAEKLLKLYKTNGKDILQDFFMTSTHYKKYGRLEYNNKYSMYYLGYLYKKGIFVKKDVEMSNKLLEKSCNLGCLLLNTEE